MAGISAAASRRDSQLGHPDHRSPVGTPTSGTIIFAPVGEVVCDGDFVLCHLCGRWLRSVTAHLRAHGWTKAAYCAAFGLERGQSLEGIGTRKKRAAAFSARLIFDPAVRAGSERGRQRARSGELTRAAATAARGRALPEQRRRKASRAMIGRRSGSADANKQRAARQLASVAAAAAKQGGYADIGELVRARTAQGASLAAISRQAGLHKDWLSRHLAVLDPVTAAMVKAGPPPSMDQRWLPVIGALGFTDVERYLRDRHLAGHQTVNAIADEMGMSYHTVAAAMRRHGVARLAHEAKRHAARQRAARVAATLGYASTGEYVTTRRTQGWTWSAIAAESGEPQTWLRRQANAQASTAR